MFGHFIGWSRGPGSFINITLRLQVAVELIFVCHERDLVACVDPSDHPFELLQRCYFFRLRDHENVVVDVVLDLAVRVVTEAKDFFVDLGVGFFFGTDQRVLQATLDLKDAQGFASGRRLQLNDLWLRDAVELVLDKLVSESLVLL